MPAIFKNHGSLGLKFSIQVAGRRIPLREYNGRKDGKEGWQLARADLAMLKKWLTLGELTAESYPKYFPASPNIAKLQTLGVQVERPNKVVPTVEAFIRDFIRAKEKHGHPRATTEQLKSLFRTARLRVEHEDERAHLDRLATLRRNAIDPLEADTYLLRLIDVGVPVDRLNRIRSRLIGLFTHAGRYYKIENPFKQTARAKSPKASLPRSDNSPDQDEDDTPADPFTSDECRRALAMRDRKWLRERDMFAIGVGSGLRRGELFALATKDLDEIEKGKLKVRRALGLGNEIKAPKTEASRRDVFVDEIALKALKRRLKTIELKSAWLFPGTGPKKPLDMKAYLRPPSAKWVGAWARFLKAAGIRYRPMGQLRHTHAVLMYQNRDTDVRFLAQQLGHADLEMLERHYLRWKPNSLVAHSRSVIRDAIEGDSDADQMQTRRA